MHNEFKKPTRLIQNVEKTGGIKIFCLDVEEADFRRGQRATLLYLVAGDNKQGKCRDAQATR